MKSEEFATMRTSSTSQDAIAGWRRFPTHSVTRASRPCLEPLCRNCVCFRDFSKQSAPSTAGTAVSRSGAEPASERSPTIVPSPELQTVGEYTHPTNSSPSEKILTVTTPNPS